MFQLTTKHCFNAFQIHQVFFYILNDVLNYVQILVTLGYYVNDFFVCATRLLKTLHFNLVWYLVNPYSGEG